MERRLALTRLTFDSRLAVVAAAYTVLFVVGLCGNIKVLAGVRRLSKFGGITINTTIIYLVALCCADIASTLSLPATIADQLLGT